MLFGPTLLGQLTLSKTNQQKQKSAATKTELSAPVLVALMPQSRNTVFGLSRWARWANHPFTPQLTCVAPLRLGCRRKSPALDWSSVTTSTGSLFSHVPFDPWSAAARAVRTGDGAPFPDVLPLENTARDDRRLFFLARQDGLGLRRRNISAQKEHRSLAIDFFFSLFPTRPHHHPFEIAVVYQADLFKVS